MISLSDLPAHVTWTGSQLKQGLVLGFSLAPARSGSSDTRMLWAHISGMKGSKKDFEIHLEPCLFLYLEELDITPRGLGHFDEELEDLARLVQKFEVRFQGEAAVRLEMHLARQDCPQIWQYQPGSLQRLREDLFEDPRDMAIRDGLPLWEARPIRLAA